MPRGFVQRVQDSVHGLMEFHGTEGIVLDLLRTPELRRLKEIQQTGLTNEVFPGTEHSRFVHSLGAAYLARQFARHLASGGASSLAEQLIPSESAIRDLTVAALCHDIGHGPLSHAWERVVIPHDFDRERWIVGLGLERDRLLLQDAKWHELIGHALLAWPGGQLHQILEGHERGLSERVKQLLRGRYYLGYLPRLLSSDVDVDRADFLVRDAHQAGVAYGRYDVDWLISTCRVGQAGNGDLVVGFDERKGTRVVEQFLVARNALYDTVYHHKTVRAAEGMVERLIRRCRDQPPPFATGGPLEPLFRPISKIIRDEIPTPEELLQLTDSLFHLFVRHLADQEHNRDPVSSDLARRLMARDLFKLVEVDPKRLDRFCSHEDWRERIQRELSRFVSDGEYYFYRDQVEFSWFTDNDRSSEWGYFINAAGLATPIRHSTLGHYNQEAKSRLWLYTIREAVDHVGRLIA